MATLPYVTSPGTIDRALNAIRSAAVPERISQDFVKTILKIRGGAGDQMTAFLKKIGLANPDGSPNELYRKFRNPDSSGAAIAAAIRHAYSPLYTRNEYMHELSDSALLGLVVEETGQPHDSRVVQFTVSTIKHLKSFANFNVSLAQEKEAARENPSTASPAAVPAPMDRGTRQTLGLNLGYTINLNLPATSDPEVFDAIFKSLKQHLLRQEDA